MLHKYFTAGYWSYSRGHVWNIYFSTGFWIMYDKYKFGSPWRRTNKKSYIIKIVYMNRVVSEGSLFPFCHSAELLVFIFSPSWTTFDVIVPDHHFHTLFHLIINQNLFLVSQHCCYNLYLKKKKSHLLTISSHYQIWIC